jgi:hypothetical protein
LPTVEMPTLFSSRSCSASCKRKSEKEHRRDAAPIGDYCNRMGQMFREEPLTAHLNQNSDSDHNPDDVIPPQPAVQNADIDLWWNILKC